MPLRYNKTLRQIFKEILHMQQIGQLDAATDDKLREYLHTHRKAFRELQRYEDKQLLARAVQWYAQRVEGGVRGYVCHAHHAKGFLAYEIDVLDKDGQTLALDTVGHVWLMSAYADKHQQCPVPAAHDAWDDFFKCGPRVSDDFGDGIQ